MKDLVIESARRADCQDMPALEHAVAEATRNQRSLIDEVLDTKLVNEEAFLEQLSNQLELPWIAEIEQGDNRKLRKVCSAQVALRNRLLPIFFDDGESDEAQGDFGPPAEEPDSEGDAGGNGANGSHGPNGGIRTSIRMATYDPFNLTARQAASQAIEHPIEWSMASRTRVLESLQKLYGVGADVFEQLLAGRDSDFADQAEEASVIDDDDEEASVVKFVNQIVREALEQRATDIHVEPLNDNLRIRYRIDGLLIDVPVPDNIKALQSSVIARLKIMSRLDIAERRLPQDGRINLSLEGRGIDVRVATIPTVEGESVSLRLLNQEKFTLERLGLLPHIRSTIDKLLKMSNGIVLITGPTGSGKSTSLYTFLSELNTTDTRIVTIEDPVENKLDGVMQIAVKSEINLTFANGLRSILRGDPNIVMVGEIRDLETAEIAVRASLTGHLVFSTLHTNDSIGGISRLIDMGVEPFLVAASVRAFLAQRLVRRLCPKCRKPTHYTEDYLKSVGFPTQEEGMIFDAVGCDSCRGTGFYGRMAIYEICVITPGVEDLIVQGKTSASIREQVNKEGFVDMRDYGFLKVLQGETTLEEVLSVTTISVESDIAVV